MKRNSKVDKKKSGKEDEKIKKISDYIQNVDEASTSDKFLENRFR